VVLTGHTFFYFKINLIGHISIQYWFDAPLVIPVEKKIYVFLIPFFKKNILYLYFFHSTEHKFQGLRFSVYYIL
jgi:hypothetical protein